MKKIIEIVFLSLTLFLGQASFAQLPDFTTLVASQGRAVVNINTTQKIKSVAGGLPRGFEGDPFFEFFKQFTPPQQERELETNSLGSGFIISPDGYVLTNAHVVAKADQIMVTLTDKREFKARLIGADARTDVALLKIEAQNLPAVTFGQPEKLKPGEWVVAIGSPFGFENSVSAGVVSATNRHLPSETYVPFIQTDVAVNPGNSGGPLFNMEGKVVGINSQIYSRSGGFMGISFAIPIDTAMKITDQLKAKGRVSRGYLGVSIQELDKELAASFGLNKPKGALINSVEKNSAADKGGIKAGDIVLRIGTTEIESVSDLPRLIADAAPGSRVNLEIWRNKHAQNVTVTVEENKDDVAGFTNRATKPQPEAKDRSALEGAGLALQNLNPQQLQQLKKLGFDFGILVTDVNNVALKAGVRRGDIIVGIGGNKISSGKHLIDEFNAAKGKTVPLQVLRQGRVAFFALPVGQ